MTSDNPLTNLFKSDRDIFRDLLGSFVLIDIGIIESVTREGRAVVLTNQYVANTRVIYQDAEVVFPGNTCGAYMAECSGAACLILMPYTCMPDTGSEKIRPGAPPYHKDGVKVIPIGNGSKSVVSQVIGGAGEYSISTAKYTLSFDRDTISLTQGDVLSLAKDGKGNIALRHKDADTGVLLFSIGKEGIHRTYDSKDGSVVWEDSVGTDGLRTLVQKDSQDNILSQITIDAEGILTVQSAKDVVVNTEGDIKLNGDSKHLVKYEDLEQAMTKLYTALTTTPIIGNGSPQSTWTGITSIDISASKADTLLTGD